MRQGHLFLVGFMGSGKSTVARLVAAQSGRPFVELDSMIEERAGRSIADLFLRDGEKRFRELEAGALARLDRVEPSIVATGGGAFVSAPNRRRMRRSGLTAWLDVSLEQARARVGGEGEGDRPMWREDDRLAFRAFFERRRACYALADYRFLTNKKPPKTVAIDVFKRFEGIF